MRTSHISWNLVGLGIPIVIAALTVPALLQSLGAQRFGLLTLAWGLIGYATTLDFGIGRAATHQIAALRGSSAEPNDSIPGVLTTAERITFVTGTIGALAVLISLAIGADSLLKVEQVPRSEIQWSMALLALALPLQAISATYRGVNEAYLNFRGISILRMLLGAANFGVPCLVAFLSPKLYWLILSLVLSRALAALMYRRLARRCIGLKRGSRLPPYSRDLARKLAGFGGWFTLSGVLSPIVMSADRFFIASIVSSAAATAYVIPYEMVAQSLVLLGAVTTVAFPYLSQRRVSAPDDAKRMFYLILSLALIAMSVVAAAFGFLGNWIISLWLGKAIPEGAEQIVRILSLGLLPYTVASMYIALLHSDGRTEVTAKINIVEFPVFLLLTYLMIARFGIVGAAYAWVLRLAVDAILLVIAAESDLIQRWSRQRAIEPREG
ncbi:Polysaccharide biosynthesis protein C-terminal domain-containing protein [Cupriavidus necator]|uniref:flippase n=1 Tax=Cupriavidus necator TaxID=106590 RepID=UPI003F73BA40